MVQEGPRYFESSRKVSGERFHAKSFGCIMAAVKNVQPKLLRQRVCPMRPFARHEGINALLCRLLELTARAACDYADALANLAAARNYQWLGAGREPQAVRQICAPDTASTLESNELPMIQEEWMQFFQAQRSAKLRV